MTKSKYRNSYHSRIERLERKCDRVLSELIIIRQKICRQYEIDTAIDKMHRTARNMRKLAERERDLSGKIFTSIVRK